MVVFYKGKGGNAEEKPPLWDSAGVLALLNDHRVSAVFSLSQPSFQEECKFRETLLPNNYNAYESDLYRGTYIALSKYGRVKRGSKVSPIMIVTHFLPRI